MIENLIGSVIVFLCSVNVCDVSILQYDIQIILVVAAEIIALVAAVVAVVMIRK